MVISQGRRHLCGSVGVLLVKFFFLSMPVGIVVWTVRQYDDWPAMRYYMHWRAMWTAFDLLLATIALAAALLLLFESPWACLPLAGLAAMFALDLFFDYMTSEGSEERAAALNLGLAYELPLVAICLATSGYTLHKALNK